jgi:hypothetical protein
MLGKMKKGWRSLFSGGGSGDGEDPDKAADKDAKDAKDAKAPAPDKNAKPAAPDKGAKAPSSDKNQKGAAAPAPAAKAAPAPAPEKNAKAPSSDKNQKVAAAPAKAPVAAAPAPVNQQPQESESGVTNLDSGLILLESPAAPPATPPRETPPSSIVEWATTPASARPGSNAEERAQAAAEWDDILARARAALPPKDSRKRTDG